MMEGFIVLSMVLGFGGLYVYARHISNQKSRQRVLGAMRNAAKQWDLQVVEQKSQVSISGELHSSQHPYKVEFTQVFPNVGEDAKNPRIIPTIEGHTRWSLTLPRSVDLLVRPYETEEKAGIQLGKQAFDGRFMVQHTDEAYAVSYLGAKIRTLLLRSTKASISRGQLSGLNWRLFEQEEDIVSFIKELMEAADELVSQEKTTVQRLLHLFENEYESSFRIRCLELIRTCKPTGQEREALIRQLFLEFSRIVDVDVRIFYLEMLHEFVETQQERADLQQLLTQTLEGESELIPLCMTAARLIGQAAELQYLTKLVQKPQLSLNTRQWAFRQLVGHLQPSASDSQRLLEQIIEANEDQLLNEVLVQMVRLDCCPSLPHLVKMQTKSGPTKLIAELLGQYKGEREAEDALLYQLRTLDSGLYLTAVQALGKIGSWRSLQDISPLQKGLFRDEALRQAAQDAVAAIQQRHQESKITQQEGQLSLHHAAEVEGEVSLVEEGGSLSIPPEESR